MSTSMDIYNSCVFHLVSKDVCVFSFRRKAINKTLVPRENGLEKVGSSLGACHYHFYEINREVCLLLMDHQLLLY